MHICIRIASFRNMLIQTRAKLLRKKIPPNIDDAKYNTFKVVLKSLSEDVLYVCEDITHVLYIVFVVNM